MGCLLGAVLLGVLALPAIATAGTYNWDMPQNFTATAPGSNPDHDNYGGDPWSYWAWSSGSQQALQFSTSVDGGLSGWGNGDSFLAENATGSTVSGVQPGQFAMQPSQTGTVELQWTSPLAGNVSVTGTVQQVNTSLPSCGFVWAVSSGNVVFSHGSDSGSISATIAVQPGATILFYMQDTSASYDPSCDTAVVNLTISAASTTPAVTLTSPTAGQTVTGQPTFIGSASTGFGNSGLVIVRVYNGSSATGSPVDTMTPGISGGGYSTGPNPVLASGTYTAQAEQDDAAGDQGLSQAVTFTVDNVPPTIALNSPGTPLTTATPTLTGTASTAAGNNAQVFVGVYSGSKLVRLLATTRSAAGQFALTISPGLPDGVYTAWAGQQGIGGDGFSSGQTFQVKVHPPALTFAEPSSGGEIRQTKPVFSGNGGKAVGDDRQVTLSLYSNPIATGTPLATLVVPVVDGKWVYNWPGTLPLGLYSAVVKQSDDAGHTTVSDVHTFLVTVTPQVIGYVLDLTKKNYVSVTVRCPNGPATCVGDVLAITDTKLQPVPGGPKGNLRLLFAHVRIRGGQTILVRRKVPRLVAKALRLAQAVEVRVGAIMSQGQEPAIRINQRRLLAMS